MTVEPVKEPGAEPTREGFEALLRGVCETLTEQANRDGAFQTFSDFQEAVGAKLEELSQGTPFTLDGKPHPHIFPDFSLGEYGAEVKFVKTESWRSVANSVFERRRSEKVKHIYVVFGRMGGKPEVRFRRYDDCVVHVRTSHVPRFEVDMTAERSLFEASFGITYEEFSGLSELEKMTYVRQYARSRLKEGERLWWLGDAEGDAEGETHTVDLGARLYTSLSMDEKLKVSAEAALLCPRVVAPSRSKGKYDDVALYLITYHGILAHQARDLFSAGSAADRRSAGDDEEEDENHVRSALKGLEDEMRAAAEYLPAELFEEYWGEATPPEDRLRRWLEKADELAEDWTPSQDLFQDS